MLPQELFDDILAFLAEDNAALNVCSLVCWTWCRTTRSYLFQTVNLFTHPNQQSSSRYSRFLELLRNPHCTFPTHARELQFRDSDDPDQSWQSFVPQLHQFTGLQNLLVTDADFTDGIGKMHPQVGAQLLTLHLSVCDFDNEVALHRLLDGLTNLQKLDLGRVKSWTNAVAYPPTTSRPSHPTVQELQMQSVYFTDPDGLSGLLSSFPNLQILNMQDIRFESIDSPAANHPILPRLVSLEGRAVDFWYIGWLGENIPSRLLCLLVSLRSNEDVKRLQMGLAVLGENLKFLSLVYHPSLQSTDLNLSRLSNLTTLHFKTRRENRTVLPSLVASCANPLALLSVSLARRGDSQDFAIWDALCQVLHGTLPGQMEVVLDYYASAGLAQQERFAVEAKHIQEVFAELNERGGLVVERKNAGAYE